jgi:DNA-directed RNA polymerase subunit beta
LATSRLRTRATDDRRLSFAKIYEPLPVEDLDLVAIQRHSFEWLRDAGLSEVFEEISPIEDFTGQMALSFSEHRFEEPKHSVEDCKEKDMTYSAPLFVTAEFVNRTTGEIKSQTVFMGDFPIMTGGGTFVINGTERVVVSQLVRSPGVYFESSIDKTTGRDVFGCKIIPSRGAWLEFEIDKRGFAGVRVDRKRRQHISVLYRALKGIVFNDTTGEYELADRETLESPVSSDEILQFFGGSEVIARTLEKDALMTPSDALQDIYRKLRPGEPPTAESAGGLLINLFFNNKRYDLAKVGRYKVNKKMGEELVRLGLRTPDAAKPLRAQDIPERLTAAAKAGVNADRIAFLPGEARSNSFAAILTKEDILATMSYIIRLGEEQPGYDVDDIDHLDRKSVV